MKKIRNKRILIILILVIGSMAGIIASCGKSGTVSPSSLNVRLQIVNVGPDVGSIDFFINFVEQPAANYAFGQASGYVYLTSIDTPYQIRTALSSNATLLTVKDTLRPGNKYTIFVTGLLSDKTLSYVFTHDTSTTPSLGRGKVRFLNASPRSGALDIYANNTIAFQNQQFKIASDYLELPAGRYTFTVYSTGDHTSVLSSLNTFTVQDGHLYTLYTQGLVNGPDTAAFATSILTNK